ncbi:unnamed protein product [Enterobius vermicularis]|uniref:Uncharacterized protein n=1 Tax=Enterobius vermicularis TaxID=51028 RepID=A0A0N4VPM7_ENTVE|nr:unnamed protein product [Enterobius vermicularis]
MKISGNWTTMLTMTTWQEYVPPADGAHKSCADTRLLFGNADVTVPTTPDVPVAAAAAAAAAAVAPTIKSSL